MAEVIKDRIGVLIAVRMKSSRLKSKALAPLQGKSVIAHLIERLKRVKNAGKIVLCTSTHPDDRVLLEVAENEGILSFAGSEMDVMKRFIDAASKYGFDHIVRTTGDNPLTDPQNIDWMIEEHVKGGYDFTKTEFLPIGANAEVIAVSALHRAYQMAEDTSLTEYMTTYLKREDIFKVNSLLTNDSFLKNRSLIRLTVDYEEDLRVMEEIYGRLYPADKNFTIKDVLRILDESPWIMQLNSNIAQIPLPKIRFKGEKVYDKQVILVGKAIEGIVKAAIDVIRKDDEYEIVGFIHKSQDIQLSLIDGIPILGHLSQVDKISLDRAQYFLPVFEDSKERSEAIDILTKYKLKLIDSVGSNISIR